MILVLCWLLGTSVRKIQAFLRTDVPRSQHSRNMNKYRVIGILATSNENGKMKRKDKEGQEGLSSY